MQEHLLKASFFILNCYHRERRSSWTCLRMNTEAWRWVSPDFMCVCVSLFSVPFLGHDVLPACLSALMLALCVCCRVNLSTWSISWWMPRCCCLPPAHLWPASTLSRDSRVETWRRLAGCVHAHTQTQFMSKTSWVSSSGFWGNR